MNRRHFLKSAAAIPVIPACCAQILNTSAKGAAPHPFPRRARPGDPSWPSAESWDMLSRGVEGRLIKVQSPLAACQDSPSSAACREVFRQLKNPYYIGDQPGLTQTSGWVDAWTSAPSIYAVAAARTEDVVAAVNFARDNHLRLVVKGGGHSYQGTSNSADSLLVWTRAMNHVVPHDAFVAQGCAGKQTPQPAVTVGAGAIWMQTYAKSDTAFRTLTARIISFYHDQLFNRHWGEQLVFERGNRIRIAMVFQGLLFFVHHGVGSEEWSADGFTRLDASGANASL